MCQVLKYWPIEVSINQLARIQYYRYYEFIYFGNCIILFECCYMPSPIGPLTTHFSLICSLQLDCPRNHKIRTPRGWCLDDTMYTVRGKFEVAYSVYVPWFVERVPTFRDDSTDWVPQYKTTTERLPILTETVT